MTPAYNEAVVETDLGLGGSLLAGERVNVVVTDDEGATAAFSFRMDERNHITQLSQGQREGATVRMTIDRATVERIAAGDNPAAAFNDAVRSRTVGVEGVGAVSSVEWAVVNAAVDPARLLGLF